MDAEVLRGPAGLAAVADDWNRVCSTIERRRLHHVLAVWQSHAECLVKDPNDVIVVRMGAAGATSAIVVLQKSVRAKWGLKIRQWHVPKHVELPPRGVVAAPGTSGRDILETLERTLRSREVGGWDVLSLSGVLDEAPLAELIHAPPGRAIVSLKKTCDAIVCGKTYEEMTAEFSRNFRSNLNKARNKLAKETGVEFRSATDPEGLAAGFETFLDIEDSGWKGRAGAGTALRMRPDVERYHRRLLERLRGAGAVVVNSLHVDGKAIASQVCVKHDGTLHLYKLAYDESWSRVAPGNMLLEHVIKKGIADGDVREIDILGNPRWFKDWRPVSRDVNDAHWFNGTPLGLALYSALKSKPLLSKARSFVSRRSSRVGA